MKLTAGQVTAIALDFRKRMTPRGDDEKTFKAKVDARLKAFKKSPKGMRLLDMPAWARASEYALRCHFEHEQRASYGKRKEPPSLDDIRHAIVLATVEAGSLADVMAALKKAFSR